jgi:hypothetical protein
MDCPEGRFFVGFYSVYLPVFFMRKIVDLFALVRVGMVFLCLFFSLECLFAQEQNRVFMHYDSMTICRGDSFPLHTFLKNEVEVPIGFELLGWQNSTDDFLKPERDTTLLLLYEKKEMGKSCL